MAITTQSTILVKNPWGGNDFLTLIQWTTKPVNSDKSLKTIPHCITKVLVHAFIIFNVNNSNSLIPGIPPSEHMLCDSLQPDDRNASKAQISLLFCFKNKNKQK